MKPHIHMQNTDAIAQWGRVCDDGMKRYFAATRSFSEAALKSQCALLDAAGEILTAGNKVVAQNIEKLTNGENGGENRGAHVRRRS